MAALSRPARAGRCSKIRETNIPANSSKRFRISTAAELTQLSKANQHDLRARSCRDQHPVRHGPRWRPDGAARLHADAARLSFAWFDQSSRDVRARLSG